MKTKHLLPRLAMTLALTFAGVGAQAQTATELALVQRLDQLAAELSKVRAELTQMQQRQAAAPAQMAPAPLLPEAPPSTQAATVISGYAELNYNRPTKASQNAQADVRRAVLGYQHRFDDKTKVVTEIEVEHAVSSASDPGEVAIEQAYLEHQITPSFAVRGGLFLMPVGLLNENHEPPSFFGVERNFVEMAIIPSTWREGGIQLVGSFDNGLTVQGGVSTGFDLNKWDAAATEGRESPLGAIHQELALAKSRDLALFGAVNWRGVPGLLLGASVFSGKATHQQAGAESRITLWDVHARWTPGRWDLSALYTRGAISNTAALNAPLVGGLSLIPRDFDGAYVQAAYSLWESGSYRFTPFVRYERFNTARSYADLGQGLTPAAGAGERVTTIGANFQLTPGVVVKADAQRFGEAKEQNRVNLGLGWSF
jgi:hypothetical protein